MADRLLLTSSISQAGLVGGLFMLSAVAVVGLPPLSGFVGKLLVLDAVRNSPWGWLTWSVILSTSLLGMLGFARAGSTLFWKSAQVDQDEVSRPAAPTIMTLVASGILLASLIALTISAGPTLDSLQALASQIWKIE